LPPRRVHAAGPGPAGRGPGHHPQPHRGDRYTSAIVTGEKDCARHMQAILPDFHAEGLEAVLHEKQGGWAERDKTVQGLAQLARGAGVSLLEGVEVTGFDIRGGKVHAVETTQGPIAAEIVIVAPGPWVARFWQMLGLPMRVDV